MSMNVAAASASLDVGTLFFIAICVTLLLGLFLLFAWSQERMRALGWWGSAYLVGGASGLLWRFGETVAPAVPSSIATALLFVAVGMIWSATRVFHGRAVCWVAMLSGAAFWLAASFSPVLAASGDLRIVVSAMIIAAYTVLTATELRRERRKSLIRRWPAAFVPLLHGAIFIFPVALAALSSDDDKLARGWIAVFATEVLLYVIGMAFMVLILAKDHTVRAYKTAASTDPLTGLLNRRGFYEAVVSLCGRNRKKMAPISLLAFDLDRFKTVNDRYGHATGDAVLQLFAKVARETLRANDIVGRIGGEEFVAVLPVTSAEAAIAAERVRAALEAARVVCDGNRIGVTVSIGIASSAPTVALNALIARADEALYRAKANGRNRVEFESDAPFAPAPAAAAAINAARPKRVEKGAVHYGAPESCIA
jgi:diguanylate cyclase (GGDEF)-like protein